MINNKMMPLFERSLADRPRAMSLYTSAIITLFNAARDYYNDEDNDVIAIKHSLSKYHAPRQNVAQKRALDIETMRRIISLPHIDGATRRNLALDCFILSFCLMGMNSADLYNASILEGNTIIYNRTKTKDRRVDAARMEVVIPTQVSTLATRYLDAHGDHVFNFHHQYANIVNFNRALNIGLKEIAGELGLDSLQFYAARHSMATIAVNDVRISKYVVNDMLCHTDASMRVTDLYIKKDYSEINEANAKLMQYVFGKQLTSCTCSSTDC